jgi:hypothetical protein
MEFHDSRRSNDASLNAAVEGFAHHGLHARWGRGRMSGIH